VFLAEDTRLNRKVALKILPADVAANEDRMRRFVQEAKSASALNHPNIITIYDIGSADGIDFIAMEFVAGKTLDRCISRHGLRLDEALKYSTHVIFHSNIWRTAAPLLDGRPSTGDRESLKLVKSAAPLISSTRADSAPQFSPDGKRIAFMSNRSGNDEIWVCDSDGSNSIQLTSFDGPNVTTPRWSPDGDELPLTPMQKGSSMSG